MTWNPSWPIGTVSVKANQLTGQQNTTYIDQRMGSQAIGSNTISPPVYDHFWNITGGNHAGHHRFIQSVGFTSTASTPDTVYPVLQASMQTVLFPLATNGTTQWFHKNSIPNTNIYQVTPTLLTGATSIPNTAGNAGTYTTLATVPANVFGEIFMWATFSGSSNDAYRVASGYFVSNGSFVQAFATPQNIYGSNSPQWGLFFLNGTGSTTLEIKAARSNAPVNTWNWRITYRAML